MSALMQDVQLESLTELGPLPKDFRNIRAFADEEFLRLHCIEGKTIAPQQLDKKLKSLTPQSRCEFEKSISGEIVEGERTLSLLFRNLVGWMAHEEGVFRLPFGFDFGKHPSNICRVLHSPWIEETREFCEFLQISGAPIQHFRILSLTTIVDVLAATPEFEWIRSRNSIRHLTSKF